MSTFLFDSIIFGPVWSRRLGESLGINLLPLNRKICNFSCIYCECGLTPDVQEVTGFPPRHEVKKLLGEKLLQMKKQDQYLDSITFAGNGEPTLHPDFPGILEDSTFLRDTYFPDALVTVLSNATRIGEQKIFDALLKADVNILKLDSANEHTLRQINCPRSNFDIAELIRQMGRFNGRLTIQTLFFRGSYGGKRIDNTAEDEIVPWLEALGKIRPQNVMIYSLARDTAVKGLEEVSPKELHAIARRVEAMGISTQVNP
jgi:wyosine [tRNA(Phe)-imidazoG37] synthetase (radical SAM superfamily)